MDSKEKALELIEKFENYVDYQGDDCFNEREKMLINAKKCALIAVEEILNSNPSYDDYGCNGWIIIDNSEYWHEVKEEINKL